MEKIDAVVQRITQRVLKETCDASVFDELTMLKEHLNSKWCDYLEYIPTFAKLSRAEMRQAQDLLRAQLVKELNKEENSFLRTIRIINALVDLGYKIPKKGSNKKVQFCYEIWKANMDNEFKTMRLLDQI